MSAGGAIVMAVHRPDPELLVRQIRSLQAQTNRDWTCLVGLDGVDAPAVAQLAALVGNDPRFQMHAFVDNVGHYRHFERLLGMVPVEASWFALCDQDDRWRPD